jgi:uncharacterized protein (TIGR03435 family)
LLSFTSVGAVFHGGGPKASSSDDDPAPIFVVALQEQLGPKIVDARAPFDTVVVDPADRVPADNYPEIARWVAPKV